MIGFAIPFWKNNIFWNETNEWDPIYQICSFAAVSLYALQLDMIGLTANNRARCPNGMLMNASNTSYLNWFLSFVYFQVHHGGAGTTAAGLRAAVSLLTCFLCLAFFFFFLILETVKFAYVHTCLHNVGFVVPNYYCTFLWWPTFLGRTSACQGTGTPTYPCWSIFTRKIGWCNNVHDDTEG